MLWARVDYKELVSKNSSFLNCFEEKPSAHCSASALWLVCCMFANSLIDERVTEQEYCVSSTLLLVFYFYQFFYEHENKLYWNHFSFMYKVIIPRDSLIKYRNDFMVSWTWLGFECTLLSFFTKSIYRVMSEWVICVKERKEQKEQ